MLLKAPIILKNAKNKSCPKLHSLQKTQRTHISISPKSGAREPQTFAIFQMMHLNGKVGLL